jgi:GNAT superfamily N-acetyltransferase
MEWQALLPTDLDALNALVVRTHAGLPERPEVFAEKVGLFPDGCMKVMRDGQLVAYGIAHSWKLHSIPALDGFLEEIPVDANCLYIHDVAVSPEATGNDLAHQFIIRIKALANDLNISKLALVSVYGTSVLWSRFGFAEYDDANIKKKLRSYGETARYMICELSRE